MSKNLKIILVAVMVLGAGILYFLNMPPLSTIAPLTENKPNTTTPTQSPTSTSDQSTANDSSNTALDSDVATIDSAMKNLDTDSMQADAGLNDKPIAQGQ